MAVFQSLLLVLAMFAVGCGGQKSPMGVPTSPAQVVASISVANPVDVAVNSATNRIYVLNDDDGTHPGTVTMIDGNTNSVTATGVVLPDPTTIAVNSTTNKIYASDGVNSLVVINGATNSTQSIPASVGDSVCPIAVDPAIDRIYSICDAANLTVIDGATNNVSIVGVATGVYGDSPNHIAFNSATHDVYVSNASRGGSTEVTKIDGTTLQTSSVPLNGASFSSYDVAVNSLTNKVYVSGGELLAIIDGKTLSTQTMTIGGFAGLIAVNSATNNIYFRSKESAASPDSVTVMDGSTLVATTVPTGQYAAAIVVDEGINQTYVVNRDSATVTVIDGASNATTTLPVAYAPEHAALNPITHRLYVTSFCSDVSSCANGTVTVIEGPH